MKLLIFLTIQHPVLKIKVVYASGLFSQPPRDDISVAMVRAELSRLFTIFLKESPAPPSLPITHFLAIPTRSPIYIIAVVATMPQAAVSLLDLYSDDSDEDMGYLPVPAQISKPIDSRKVGGLASVTTTTTTKKNASKNAALAPAASKTKVTKSGAKSVKEKAATGKKAAVARKPSREVLSERRSPNRSEDEIEMEDELGNEDVVEEPVQAKKTAKRGKKAAVAQKEDVDAAPAPAAKLTKKGRGKLEEEPAAPAAEQSKKSARGRPKGSKATTGAASVKPEAAQSVVPETQPEPELMDVEQSIEVDEFAEAQSELEPAPEPVEPTRRAARQPARQTSNQPASRRGQVNGKRAGSASDTERGGSGAEMRRRLGEMTKELDKLRLRYDDLRAVGVQDRESNFDRLKKSTDQREKGTF